MIIRVISSKNWITKLIEKAGFYTKESGILPEIIGKENKEILI